MIHVNRKRKGKTLKLLLVWEVPLSHMWKVFPNTGDNSICGGFQSKRNVLPKHIEFASLGFD